MKAKILNVQLTKPTVCISDKHWKAVRCYFREGYFIASREDGYFILNKKTRIEVTFEYNGKVVKVNLTDRLIKVYGEMMNTHELYEAFKHDLEEEKITLEVDSNEYYYFIKE